MAVTIQSIFGVTRINVNVQAPSGIPQEQEVVTSTTARALQNTQLVGTSHELITIADMTDSCMLLLKNMDAAAIVEVGLVVAATFYPLFNIPPGERSKLSRVSALGSLYLKSNVANTELEVTLYKIAA